MNEPRIDDALADLQCIYEILDELGRALPRRTVEVNDLINGIGETVTNIILNLKEAQA